MHFFVSILRLLNLNVVQLAILCSLQFKCGTKSILNIWQRNVQCFLFLAYFKEKPETKII